MLRINNVVERKKCVTFPWVRRGKCVIRDNIMEKMIFEMNLERLGMPQRTQNVGETGYVKT